MNYNDMNENKLKHLEFIQNVITRMNSNSFMIKGWTITLVAALFALAAKDANINYVLISYIVIPAFWILDGFFISIEKQYRELYKEVAAKNINNIDFSMDASNYNDEDRTWLRGLVSKTILPFYGISLVTTLFVMWLL
ncbi:hypothetical protein [Adhaeribacter soli]|nr:hypothetical protein [Adhaeribacter soli]